jgi:hypothetical protein
MSFSWDFYTLRAAGRRMWPRARQVTLDRTPVANSSVVFCR